MFYHIGFRMCIHKYILTKVIKILRNKFDQISFLDFFEKILKVYSP
jgi:hypothetical protein